MSDLKYVFVVEHLDPELEAWQALEYNCIAAETTATGDDEFILSGVAKQLSDSTQLKLQPTQMTEESVEKRFGDETEKQKVCLLDPKAEHDLSPTDCDTFRVFLFGGILGDDPPRDRTAELRKLGFARRRLGTLQMTTDTAVRVTRMIVKGQQSLHDIAFVDRPDIKVPTVLNAEEGAAGPRESVSMPFRYVQAKDGTPVMPPGMLELLAKDSEKGIMDLL